MSNHEMGENEEVDNFQFAVLVSSRNRGRRA